RTTFRLLDAVDGGSEVAGVATATITDRVDPRSGSMDRENVVDDLLDANAMDMSDMLGHDAHAGKIPSESTVAPADTKFDVQATVANLNIPVVARRDDGQYEVMATKYHPEVLSATVEVDGMVVGTTPGPFVAKPGIHKMRVRRDLFEDWQGTVNIRNGMKLTIAMKMTDEGLREYAGLSELFEHLKAHAILTDAEAKVLEGKATELSHSAIRVDIGQGGAGEVYLHDHTTGAHVWAGTTRP
ncbi:MAG TPA: PEGA domain-containing protein, partial [Tepidisphaeraceae bacterium]|nr:PEGA domain-containing protein [Tepidisphaeraceae bacterium]